MAIHKTLLNETQFSLQCSCYFLTFSYLIPAGEALWSIIDCFLKLITADLGIYRFKLSSQFSNSPSLKRIWFEIDLDSIPVQIRAFVRPLQN